MSPQQKVRDYRDEIDIDEQLDAIRVIPRDQARELYSACLDSAYHQGRYEGVNAVAHKTQRMAAEVIATMIFEDLKAKGKL